MIIINADKLQDGLYQIQDGQIRKYKANGGTVRAYELGEMSQEDFATLCICAIRYCHGRRTYMPSLVQGIVRKHFDVMSDRDMTVLLDDCGFQRTMNLYGDDCDKVDWLKWEQDVKNEIKGREDGEA